ncbi:porin family protein [Phocaeicola sp.]|uniref:porin family protein n=1 Tax=Phocaeicola sp. TaxID=2773926 RepID=UPI0023D70410|nr:porin family protein [Phocaeicola sp.]MDE5677738.1 porin family protein [Phocaeicola sp.]
MKKIISVLMVAVCLMMAAPVQAQLHLGVKGGLNLSKVSFSKSDWKGDNKTGWFVGPMAEFTLPIVGIGADVAALYSQTDLAAKGYEVDAKLKTIEIPVNLKWSFGMGSMLGAYIAAGPQFGFNIGNKNGFMDYELKKHNTTFNVGAGLKLIRHLQLGVNYNFALSHTATIDVNEYETIKIKNNTWQVSLAYLF